MNPDGPAPGHPEKPWTIRRDKIAEKLWDDLVPILVADKAVGVADGMGLTCLCSAFGRLVRARLILQEDKNWVVDGATGGVKAHPMLAVEQSACNELFRYADGLGLTPTARARITRLERDAGEKKAEEDMELEELLAS